MIRPNTATLPVEELTLAELRYEHSELQLFIDMGRAMHRTSGFNVYRQRSVDEAKLRLMFVEAFIEHALADPQCTCDYEAKVEDPDCHWCFLQSD